VIVIASKKPALIRHPATKSENRIPSAELDQRSLTRSNGGYSHAYFLPVESGVGQKSPAHLAYLRSAQKFSIIQALLSPGTSASKIPWRPSGD
jgi:hypothetical protein